MLHRQAQAEKKLQANLSVGKDHSGEIWSCSVSADNFYIATAGGADGRVVVSDTDGKFVKIWQQDTFIDGVAIAHLQRGENIVINSQRLKNKICLFKIYGEPHNYTLSDEMTLNVEIPLPTRCRSSGKWLAVCSSPDKACVVDIERQTVFRALIGHTKPVTRVEWQPGSTSTLITGSEDGHCLVAKKCQISIYLLILAAELENKILRFGTIKIQIPSIGLDR